MNKLPKGANPLYRKLAYKSVLGFGKYADMTVSNVLKVDPAWLAYAYYFYDRISFIDEILDFLQVDRIEKPGKRPALSKKCHAKVRDTRHEFLHKVTHELTHDSQVRTIFIEDLNVRSMVKNRHLAKTISDAAFGEFVRQLTYKGMWYGVNVIKVDRWAPSSKTCSVCGAVNRSLKLSERVWTCVCCGTCHDRDYNASVNIKSFGLAALPPDRREVKPADCPPVDDRRSPNALRSSGRLNQEKFRGATDAPVL